MFWLNKYPHLFNYPQQITKENAERLYTVGTGMIRTINALITWIFVYYDLFNNSNCPRKSRRIGGMVYTIVYDNDVWDNHVFLI